MDAIILDIDGTLIESMAVDTKLYFASIADVVGPVGVRDDLNDYEHVTDTGILRELLADNDVAVDAAVVEAIRDCFIGKITTHIESVGPFAAIDGAARFVERLRASHRDRVAIATGGWGRSATVKLESAGIDVRGIPLVSADDAESRTEIMRIAAGKLAAPFDSVTYFGDAEWDRKACRALGWKFVAVGDDLGGIRSFDNLDLSLLPL